MKKLLLFSIMLILLSSFTFAFDLADPDILFYYDMDDAGAEILDGKDNDKPQINLDYDGNGNLVDGLVASSTNAIQFTSDDANTSILPDWTSIKNITIGCFINTSWEGATTTVFSTQYRPAANRFGVTGFIDGDTDDVIVQWGDNTGAALSITVDIGEPRYFYYIVRINSTDAGIGQLFINDTIVGSSSGNGITFTTGHCMHFGANDLDCSGNPGNAIVNTGIDECFAINRTLTEPEITDIWENGFEIIDLIAPSFSNNKTNSSSIGPIENGGLQINITVTDDIDVDMVILATNQSGTLVNISNQSFSGTSDTSVTASFNISISMEKGLMSWQVWANDSSNNQNISEVFTQQVFNDLPTTPVITSPHQNEINNTRKIDFSSIDADTGDTLTYSIYINGTINISTTTNITVWNGSDGFYNLTISVNDGTIDSANSTPIFFTLDQNAPIFSSTVKNETPHINNDVNFSTIITDVFPDSYMLFHNRTNGTLANQSSSSYTSGVAVTEIISFTTAHENFCWGFWANDTAGNSNTTTVDCFTVQNTAPTVTLTSPDNNDHNNVNLSVFATCNDVDGDVTKSYLSVNGSISSVVNASVNLSIGFNLTTTDMITDGAYSWNVSCYDGIVNVTSVTRLYILDTTDPLMNITSPLNNSVLSGNFHINVSMTDTNPRLINYTLFCGATIYQSNQTQWTSGTYLSLNDSVDITALAIPDGGCTINFSVSDAINVVEKQHLITIDTTTPVITLNGGNSFNDSNISLTNQYANYLNFNISITDDNEVHAVIINVTTPNGTAVFEYSNFSLGAGNMSFNFSQNVSTSTWDNVVYIINISASDPHTAFSIDDYEIEKYFNRLVFHTPEDNQITISSDGSVTSTEFEKKRDRYEFGFNYLLESDTRTFTVKSENKIYYLPNSQYQGHFVIYSEGVIGNWIDFEGIDGKPSITKISDREYEITFTNIKPSKRIIAKSLGSTNVVSKKYFWYKGNSTTIAPTSSIFGNTETFVLNISRNLSFVIPNASFIFDGIEQEIDFTFNDEFIIFSSDVVITEPSSASEIINLSWVVNITQQDDSIYSFDIERSINVSLSILDNCGIYNTTILTITGRDEETDEDVVMDLNIFFDSSDSGNLNSSFELSGSTNYTFCSDASENFTVSAVMEYGDLVIYADRKYYLNDFQIDITSSSEVFLYHLNNSKASEIVFTVFDSTTGDKVRDAFIEILRYYPGENVFRVVEIAKTDETGKSLGKMVLADVFYKFIIKKPAGTIKLDTGILRVLSLTRSFGIAFATDPLDTWRRIEGVDTSVTCTRDTQTCRITWSDTSSVVQDIRLEVWRMNGLADEMLFSNTVAAASGTISYTIIEDTTGNRYVAKGFIESNTGRTTYPTEWASLIYSDNPFFTDSTHRLASIFPLFLLMIVLVFALIDFGTVGIVIGSMLGLVTGSIVGILPLSPFYFVSFIIMGIILIYKLSK